MSEIVEKWVAGIYSGRLHVAKGHFKKTKKQYRREGGSHADDIDLALGFASQFDHNTDRLHDSAEGALAALRLRAKQDITRFEEKIYMLQGHINLADDFEIST